MQSMTTDEIRTFMGSGSKTGKLATVSPDGTAHVAPVWFTFDAETGDAVFLTWHSSKKARNIRHEPRVSILVDDETFPFSWARLDGVASFGESDLRYWATESCRRYVGDDRADVFGERNAVDGELVVRVRPTKLVGQRGIAD